MPQDRPGFARIVIAVVVEKNDLPANLCLQSPSRLKLCKQKSPGGKIPQGLLTETNHRCSWHWLCIFYRHIT